MSVGPLRIVTIGVTDTEDALRLFRDVVGLRIEAEWEASPDLLDLWELNGSVSAQVTHLSYQGYPSGQLRLVEHEPAATRRVRDDFDGPDSAVDVGPKAIDFYVNHDLDEAIAEMTAAGFPPRSRPIHYVIGPTETEELLFTGPDGVPSLLMVVVNHPASSHRVQPPGARYSEIATVSVICDDPDRSRRFYGEVLGMNVRSAADVADDLLEVANELVGAPRGHPCTSSSSTPHRTRAASTCWSTSTKAPGLGWPAGCIRVTSASLSTPTMWRTWTRSSAERVPKRSSPVPPKSWWDPIDTGSRSWPVPTRSASRSGSSSERAIRDRCAPTREQMLDYSYTHALPWSRHLMNHLALTAGRLGNGEGTSDANLDNREPRWLRPITRPAALVREAC